MKVRKSGSEWFWIVFKYENVPTFCFICGLLGHSDKFCSKLFDNPDSEIVKPYGSWMRAPLRRPTKLIGARWLRDGNDDGDWNTATDKSWGLNEREKFAPPNQGSGTGGENQGRQSFQAKDKGANNVFSKVVESDVESSQLNPNNTGITVIENKKRRTDDGPTGPSEVSKNTELDMGLNVEEIVNMDQDMNKTQILLAVQKMCKRRALEQDSA